MSEIFISYARSTAAKAQQIAEALRGLGYNVWRDDDLPAHRSYEQVIEERLKAAKAVVVVWSADAVKSEWVQSEADRARIERKLVQLSLDGAPLPMPFDRIQCADLAAWSGDPSAHEWRKVVASVGDLIGGARPAAAVAVPAPRRHSICVLPFANMSGDPEQEYFSDGISEDIITDLSKVSALSVISRNSAFRYKGQQADIPQVASDLNVSHVLEGSVRKVGGRVRITAQLIDGLANDHVWAERYDRDIDDIFTLQDEISQAIVAALKVKLLPAEKQAIERRGTSNAEAYNLYLMARRLFVTGNRGDARREEAIVRLCARAVEIDPGYARAWALMASAQALLRYRRGRAGDDGLAAADRALQLDPALAEPHAVRAMVLNARDQIDEAQAEMETALRLDPDSHEVRHDAAAIAFMRGRPEEAIEHYARITTLEAAEFGAPAMLINLYLAKGDRNAACEAAKLTLERVETVVANDPDNGYAIAFGATALGVLGETERAKEWMNRALVVDPDNLLIRYNFACDLIRHSNDFDGAIEMLRRVLGEDVTPSTLSVAKMDPDLEPLRADPRFQSLILAAEARLQTAASSDGD